MPITKPATVSHTLIKVVVDIAGGFMLAEFIKAIDGVDTGRVELRIETGDMINIINVVGDSSKTRADDITDAIYNHALSIGAIDGSIA